MEMVDPGQNPRQIADFFSHDFINHVPASEKFRFLLRNGVKLSCVVAGAMHAGMLEQDVSQAVSVATLSDKPESGGANSSSWLNGGFLLGLGLGIAGMAYGNSPQNDQPFGSSGGLTPLNSDGVTNPGRDTQHGTDALAQISASLVKA